jgi:metallo-beta-lactamase family protein
MKVTYTPHGAARQVPGSKHLLEIERGSNVIRILTDCGIEYGHGRRDPPLRFDPKTLDAVVLTHGHADHVGELPTLMAKGYLGHYISTPATKDIVRQQLLTEQRIAEWRAKESGGKVRFTQQDIARAMQQFRLHDYLVPRELAPGVRVTFYDAGHILGSAQALYEIQDENGRWMRILMSGDLGRLDNETAFNRKPDLQYPKDIDYILMESTRGSQRQATREDSRKAWEDIVQDACRNGRRVVCGAFSIMRAQLVLDDLYRLHLNGRLPRDLPIFLDSPSAVEVIDIIRNHPECYTPQVARELARQGDNSFDFPNLHVTVTKEDSKRINRLKGPFIVIATSGMWDHGRVRYHLEQVIDDPNALLVQTGYQARGTLGRRLQEGPAEHPKLRIAQHYQKYKAGLRMIHGYSGHADIDDITKHLAGTHAKGIFLVHGEQQSSMDAARVLYGRGHDRLIIPEKYQPYELDALALRSRLWTP